MKTIITIGRQFGSGGKEIGIRVAKELGIPFYDKELLREAALESGLCEKIVENFDERPKSLLYSIAMDSYSFAVPGIGRQFVNSITGRDYPLLMGTTIVLAALIVIMNLVGDIMYKVVDPRINLE